MLLHNTFQYPVFSECGLLWTSRYGLLSTTKEHIYPPRESTSRVYIMLFGTTASLIPPMCALCRLTYLPDPGNSHSADVHLQGDSVDCYSGLPHADQRPSLLCRHVSATPHHKLVQTLWDFFQSGIHMFGLVCWSLTSLCHSNGHIETMPAREINPFSALTRIRPQFLRTQ